MGRHDQQGRRTRPKPPPGAQAGLAVAVLIVECLLVALGVWQLHRRTWKHQLIARVEARVHAPPAPPPGPATWAQVDAERDAYRHVRLEGTFSNGEETLIQALTERGSGFWVMTPLVTRDNGTVLINRGFVPADRRNPATRDAGQPTGTVDVTGLLRISEPGGSLLRGNDPATDRWVSRDVPAIAAARGLADAAPYFVDADATPNPGGLPIGGLTVVAFSDNHLVYAFTWFALAVLLALGLVWARRNRPDRGPDSLS